MLPTPDPTALHQTFQATTASDAAGRVLGEHDGTFRFTIESNIMPR